MMVIMIKVVIMILIFKITVLMLILTVQIVALKISDTDVDQSDDNYVKNKE